MIRNKQMLIIIAAIEEILNQIPDLFVRWSSSQPSQWSWSWQDINQGQERADGPLLTPHSFHSVCAVYSTPALDYYMATGCSSGFTDNYSDQLTSILLQRSHNLLLNYTQWSCKSKDCFFLNSRHWTTIFFLKKTYWQPGASTRLTVKLVTPAACCVYKSLTD